MGIASDRAHHGPRWDLSDETCFIDNMVISTTSSITRQRPSSIVWVSNILERFSTNQEQVADLFAKFDARSRGGLQATLTKKERDAAETLLFGMDPATLEYIVSQAKATGMTKKSPFSLDGFQCKLLRIGEGPSGTTETWKRLMTTTPASLARYIRKLVASLHRGHCS